MIPNFTLINVVYFKEAPTVSTSQNPFKSNFQKQLITSTKKIDWQTEELKKYCEHLLTSIIETKLEDLEDLLMGLMRKTIKTIQWLNHLEKLMIWNLAYLWNKISPKQLSRFQYLIIEKRNKAKAILFRSDGLNIRRGNGSYSFKKVKYHLDSIEDYSTKKLFLVKCKIEYLQYKPNYIPTRSTPFDEKIDLEIKRIESKERYQSLQKEKQNQSPIPTIQKIKINCQINQFADIFYQIINEKKIDDGALIETSNANMAKLIANFFTDTHGDNIEQSTIETYLQKNKPEKRPKGYNRIHLK